MAGLSGVSGRSRARSVRSTSASTYASNRSSLLPADPYRDRRFFTCRGVITTTVMPAASRASTTGPSPRSIATSAAPALARRCTRSLRPSAVCATVNRLTTAPAASTMHTAWSALAQSIPADSAPGGASGRGTRAYFITASSLLSPVGRHPCARFRDAAAGGLTDRRSPAHTALSTVGASRDTARPPRRSDMCPKRSATAGVDLSRTRRLSAADCGGLAESRGGSAARRFMYGVRPGCLPGLGRRSARRETAAGTPRAVEVPLVSRAGQVPGGTVVQPRQARVPVK